MLSQIFSAWVVRLKPILDDNSFHLIRSSN
jgi:hypothetical protein